MKKSRHTDVLAVGGHVTPTYADYMIVDRSRARALFRVRLFHETGEMIIRTPVTFKVVTGDQHTKYSSIAKRAIEELYAEEDKEKVA